MPGLTRAVIVTHRSKKHGIIENASNWIGIDIV